MINMEAGSQCRCNISVERKILKNEAEEAYPIIWEIFTNIIIFD